VEDGVGFDLAAGAYARVGKIGEADAAAGADGGGGEDEGFGGGEDDPGAGLDGDDVFDGEKAFAEGFGEDAAELGECAFGGGGEGLFVGKEERGKAEAGKQAIGATDAAGGFDGDAEVFEADDVALDGAEVDFEALGELGAGDVVAGLEDLEDGEDAHDGVIHRNLLFNRITTESVGNGG
jgi:hypothetical protein